MKKLFFCFWIAFSMFFCFSGCAKEANEELAVVSSNVSNQILIGTKSAMLTIGDSITYNSITIKVLDAVILSDSIIGVFVAINNNNPFSINYSSDYVWGNIVTGSGSKLESVLYSNPYIWQNYFSNGFIYPVATATDFITFQQFEPSESEGYTFYAEPPIEGFPSFKVFFLYDDLKKID